MAIEVKRKRRKDVYSFKPINKNIDIIPADELVYIQKSPDYCSPDRKMGSIGTQGRYDAFQLFICQEDQNNGKQPVL